MDKNTITGLVLIGILLVGFSFLSRPSEEQIAAQKKYYDSIAVVQQQQEALKAKQKPHSPTKTKVQRLQQIPLPCSSTRCMEPTLKSASRTT